MPHDVDSAATTIGDLLDHAASAFPDRDAVVVIDRPCRMTYVQLKAEADAVAKGLIGLGLQPGDHVAIWATNLPG